MPIEKLPGEGGGFIATGNGVLIYRLLAMKGAIGLEAKGMRMSRGLSWTKTARTEFNMPKAKHEELMAECVRRADALHAKEQGK